MSINALRPTREAWFSQTLKPLLEVQAESNDFDQVVEVHGRDVHLTGIVGGGGTFPSKLSLRFDGILLELPLEDGMTPQQTVAALGAALPSEYELVMRPNPNFNGEVFGISKKSDKTAAERDLDKAIADGVVTKADVDGLILPHCKDMFAQPTYRERVVSLVYSWVPPADVTPDARDALVDMLSAQSQGRCPS